MRDRLEDWEDYFASYFGKIRLLGEIPLSRLDCDQIGQLIHALINEYGQSGATRLLEENYPRTFAVYLVGMGVHHYSEDSEGAYWTAVKEATGIHSPHQSRWGERFLGILKANRLPDFTEMTGHTFVMPILAHGGIPARSLPDFFRYIVLPSIKRPQLATAPSSEVIDELVDRTTTQLFVDKPARRFLTFTGAIGADFLERARVMMRTYLDTQDLPDADKVGLPPYVVEAFRHFVEDEPDVQTGKRLRAPRLCLDPWSAEFAVYLPPEPLKGAELARGSHEWSIETQTVAGDVSTETRRVRHDRQGYDIVTRKDRVILDEAVAHVTLAFCQRVATENGDVELQVIRRWKLHLWPSDTQVPLLVFRQVGGDWRLLPWNQTLPAAELILVYPRRIELRPDRHEHERENYPEFSGPWQAWRAQRWDLNDVGVFHLLENGAEPYAPLPIEHQPPDPILVGGQRVEADVDVDEVPVYIGDPPSLRFPLQPDRLTAAERQHWEIALKSLWAARPVIIEQRNSLDYFSDQLVAQPDGVELPLKHILGTQPCGTYQLSVTNPLGIKTDLRFRVWPMIEIRNLQPYYLPAPEGSQPVRFSVRAPDGCDVQPQAGVEGVQVVATPPEFEVVVDAHTTVAELHLIDQRGLLEPIRFPLVLAVPRLHWTLLQDQAGDNLEWQTSPLKLAVDALRQAKRVDLYIELPIAGDLPLSFDLCLVDPDRKVVLQSSSSQEAHRGQTRWRFSLGEFADTLRHSEESPLLEFHLEIADYQANAIRQVPVIRLTRLLDIRAVSIDHVEDLKFCLHWDEPRPLRCRRVRIWAEWQPWLLPLEFTIPDEARGTYAFEAALPPSRYRLQFFTAATWENQEAEWPVRIPAQAHLVETATPQERLRWLQGRLATDVKPTFALHLEQACIWDTLQDVQARDHEIIRCIGRLDQATPEQSIALHDWLGQRDTYSQKAARLNLFKPERLRQLYQLHPRPSLVRERYIQLMTAIRPEMLKAESARLLLEHEHTPAIRLQAFRALIVQSDAEGARQVLEMVLAGQISEADALDLFAENAELALSAISSVPKSPVMQRLIHRLSRRLPGFPKLVTNCMWIQCEAGWGMIDSIQDGDGQYLPYFNPDVDKPILSATLRPPDFPEAVRINLTRHTITFLDVDTVFICTKDGRNHFISADKNLIIYDHTRAAHKKIRSMIHPSAATVQLNWPIRYALQPPDKLLA